MVDEQYVESILIRQDNVDAGITEPTFTDTDVDEVFEFEGTLQLIQIVKSVQNKTHNRHDYVFKIEDITKLQKEGS